MTGPTVVATNTYSNSAGSPWSVSLPAGAHVGDLELVFVTGSANSPTFTIPPGWRQLYQSLLGNTEETAAGFARRVDGSEGASVSIVAASNARVTGLSLLIRDWGGNQAGDVGVSVLSQGNGGSPDPDLVHAPSWGPLDCLFIAVMHSAINSGTVSAWPTNYAGSNIQTSIAGPSGNVMGLGTRALRAAKDDPGAFTASASNNYAAYSIIVKPRLGIFIPSLCGRVA